jgi:hypothetical protein
MDRRLSKRLRWLKVVRDDIQQLLVKRNAVTVTRNGLLRGVKALRRKVRN